MCDTRVVTWTDPLVSTWFVTHKVVSCRRIVRWGFIHRVLLATKLYEYQDPLSSLITLMFPYLVCRTLLTLSERSWYTHTVSKTDRQSKKSRRDCVGEVHRRSVVPSASHQSEEFTDRCLGLFTFISFVLDNQGNFRSGAWPYCSEGGTRPPVSSL